MSQTFAELTTMRVGGGAEKFLEATTRAQLVEYVAEFARFDDPYMLLGGGSNTIMCDDGFQGTVILVRTRGIEILREKQDYKLVRVQAGEVWDELVEWSLAAKLAGLEALSGIPGLVGAAPIQNIGAYGAELKDVLHSVELYDLDEGEVREVAAADLGLAYRDSALKRQELNAVVLSIVLRLNAAPSAVGGVASTDGVAPTSAVAPMSRVRYEQLATQLGCQVGDEVPADLVRKRVLELRASKGMVLDDADVDSHSSGSFFMNPIVTESFARSLPADAPRFATEPSDDAPVILPLTQLHLVDELVAKEVKERHVKLSAAWLIEHSGISRGFSLPGSKARISTKHTLAITNTGGATAEEVAELARFVIARVRQEFGVYLVPEPNIYGLQI